MKKYCVHERINADLKKEYFLKYNLDLDSVNCLLQEMAIHVGNREVYQIASPHKESLLRLKRDMSRTVGLFHKDDIKAVERLLKIARFKPFPKRSSAGTSGRPHDDPESYIIWELSSVIINKDGSHRGQTNWEDFNKLIEYFDGHYRYLKAIPKRATNLKNRRNTYMRHYKLTQSTPSLKKGVDKYQKLVRDCKIRPSRRSRKNK